MKIYIAGKITGEPNHKKLFALIENYFKGEGYVVINPSKLPEGFEQDEYMHMCYAMIDVCDLVYMLNNWKDSNGAKLEHEYALKKGKLVSYQPFEKWESEVVE